MAMALTCISCAGSGLLLRDALCPLCDGDPKWPEDMWKRASVQTGDFKVEPWEDLEDIEEGEVICFIGSKKNGPEKKFVVLTRKQSEELPIHMEVAVQVTPSKIRRATQEERLNLFGLASECLPPTGLASTVELWLATELRHCLQLKFVSDEKGKGVLCTWKALETRYGSDRWLGRWQNKASILHGLPCRFWEDMRHDQVSFGTAAYWRGVQSDTVREWLAQIVYGQSAEIVVDEEPVEDSGERVVSRYLSPSDSVPSRLGTFHGITENLFNFLKWNVEWSTVSPNLAVAWYTAKGYELPYSYGMGPRPATRYPDWMEALREHMVRVLELPDAPTGCNLNFYRDGSSQLKAHADDEPMFDGLNRAIKIVSFSVGQGRTFQMFGKRMKKKEKLLESLSFLTMEEWFQKHLRHQLPEEPDKSSPRINMTWRWIILDQARGA